MFKSKIILWILKLRWREVDRFLIMNKGRAINERDLKSVLVHLDGLSTSENIITYIRDTLIKSVIIHTHTHELLYRVDNI